VEAPHKSHYDAEQLVASFKSQMDAFPVADLEQIEKRRDIAKRLMKEAIRKSYSRTIGRA